MKLCNQLLHSLGTGVKPDSLISARIERWTVRAAMPSSKGISCRSTRAQVGRCLLSLKQLADSSLSVPACESLHLTDNRTASFNLSSSSLCAGFNAV